MPGSAGSPSGPPGLQQAAPQHPYPAPSDPHTRTQLLRPDGSAFEISQNVRLNIFTHSGERLQFRTPVSAEFRGHMLVIQGRDLRVEIAIHDIKRTTVAWRTTDMRTLAGGIALTAAYVLTLGWLVQASTG